MLLYSELESNIGYIICTVTRLHVTGMGTARSRSHIYASEIIDGLQYYT